MNELPRAEWVWCISFRTIPIAATVRDKIHSAYSARSFYCLRYDIEDSRMRSRKVSKEKSWERKREADVWKVKKWIVRKRKNESDGKWAVSSARNSFTSLKKYNKMLKKVSSWNSETPINNKIINRFKKDSIIYLVFKMPAGNLRIGNKFRIRLFSLGWWWVVTLWCIVDTVIKIEKTFSAGNLKLQ